MQLTGELNRKLAITRKEGQNKYHANARNQTRRPETNPMGEVAEGAEEEGHSSAPVRGRTQTRAVQYGVPRVMPAEHNRQETVAFAACCAAIKDECSQAWAGSGQDNFKYHVGGIHPRRWALPGDMLPQHIKVHLVKMRGGGERELEDSCHTAPNGTTINGST